MAWIDSLLEFSVNQAVTTDAPSTNVIDVQADPKANETFRNVGVGDDVYVVICVKVAPVATGTYLVELQTDDNEGFASPTTIQSVAIPSNAAVGDRVVMRVPQANERYLRLNYDTGGTSPAVTVSSWVTGEEPGTWYAYPDAVNGFAG